MSKRAELLELKEKSLVAARDIAAKAEKENRDFTPEERTIVTKAVEDAGRAHAEVLELDGDAKLMDSINALGRPIGELAKGAGSGSPLGGTLASTLGERFTENEAFKSWLKEIAPNGSISEKTKGIRSPAVDFALKEIYPGWNRKAIVAGSEATSAGALLFPDWLGLVDGLSQFQRPLNVIDLITKGTTGTDTVEYARVTGITNNAATVPEATGTSAGDQGGDVPGTKPESSLALTKVVANVKTIAHWIPATKRALSDAGQIRTLIDQFLRYGLDEELEDQVVSGDNTGENFEGFLEVSGTQHQAFDTDLLATARKAKTLVRLIGRARPTAYLLNPEDNERFDLLKDDMGRYYFGGPGTGSDQSLWALPRVESEAIPQGTGVVADFKTCVLWDREQASIQVSDSHADFFVRNLVAILAEMRAAFGVIRPKAICTFDIEAGS